MGAVQTGVHLGGYFYEGNKSFLCDTKHTISLLGSYVAWVSFRMLIPGIHIVWIRGRPILNFTDTDS